MTRQRIEDLTAFAVPEEPALSPDGTRTAYVLRTADVDGDRNTRAIWLTGEGGARRLTTGTADTTPAWSPDGRSLAFLRAQDGPAQLWLLPADGGEPERLTDLPLGAGAPHWSPDGGRIAFAAPVDMVDGPENAPIVTDRLGYQADGAGFLRTIRKHLHVLDLDSRETRQVTDGDWHAGEPAWSPDSTRLAYGAATAPDADLRPTAPLYVVDVAPPHSTPRQVALPDGITARVTWVDDDTFLVVGMVDPPVGHARLLKISGGETVDLTAGLDRNVMPGGPAYPGAVPQLGGDGVLFCVRDRGCTHLYTVALDGGTPRPVVAGAGRVVGGLSVAGDTAAVLLTTPTSFGEIVTVDLATGAETVRTRHTDTEVELFVREEREFTISDGTTVQGWLVRDPAVTGPGPLLLDIHGGPHNAWHGGADEVHVYHQELAALGWTVLLLNPRASDGYGEDFFTAAIGAWGTADAKDFLEPLDQLVAEGVADPARLAVAGYSYGGYMTCYLTSRDDRFAAAVAGGVVADLTSMAGTSDAGHDLAAFELGALPHADRATYAEMSPLAKVEDVRTPTLVIHGAADVRCPVGQAEQWHTALREQGVPTRLVLYPGAAHLFILDGAPSHRIDFNRRVLDWVEQYAGDAGGARRPKIDAAHWQRRLVALARKHHVPGAALGILRVGREDELVQLAHGLLNVDTGVETTADSVFQIGSISKVWTTTVVMQLVDEGLLDLDAPISEVLPELTLADQAVTEKVTMRHLLTHTSGIDGDVFTDTGRGDDAIEKYVAALADVAQNHPLGATWSYCNSGFTLAGRVIEKLTGRTWDAAMRERLFAPLGLTHTGTLPEEALLHRAAVGHSGEKTAVVAPAWALPRSAGPAGLINATVRDVLMFARLHLAGGVTPDGTRLLSDESAAAMTSLQAELPDKYTLGDSWGLGWIRMDWHGRRLYGHDGNTIGQSAFLRVLPDEGLAVTLLTNGGKTRDFYDDLYREIFAELADVDMPEPLAPPEQPVTADITPHLGRYERASVQIEVVEGEQGPRLRMTATGPIAELLPEEERNQEYDLVPVEENLYVVRENENTMWIPVTFYSLATGERYLHFGARATPKVG
ncbi:serine hydrolase [Actinophytocola sp. NPDC049390]|uniref:serine hydrolase n=1 Tax=Actinophytocola sp. NPDC049390 TaxID=3363894 RepID=UPI0037B63B7D